MEVIYGRLKLGNRGIYRITYVNGYVYVGSFVNSRRRIIGETYFGSSRVAEHYGWRKPNCIENSDYNKSMVSKLEIWFIGEENRTNQLRLERRFIMMNYSRLGVAECAKVMNGASWLNRYKRGVMLNMHCNDSTHLSLPEVRRKAVANTDYRALKNKKIKKYGYDPINSSEAATKANITRFNKYGYYFTEKARKRAAESARLRAKEVYARLDTKEAKEKSIQTRRTIGYKEASLKVAKSITGKPHFVEVQIMMKDLKTNEEWTFDSIKSCEDYFEEIGIHITRATISQGLKRTKGNYIYRDMYEFRYLNQ